jgi:hypothetical protein
LDDIVVGYLFKRPTGALEWQKKEI